MQQNRSALTGTVVSAIVNNIIPGANGILKGIFMGGLSGGVSGGLSAGIEASFSGGNFGDAFWAGFKSGAITGGAMGWVNGYFTAKEKGLNIWTGTPKSSDYLILASYNSFGDIDDFSSAYYVVEKGGFSHSFAYFPSNLGVVDINNDSIVCIIDGIVPIQMVNINDSLWSPDESKFLFTVSAGPKFIFKGEDSIPKYDYKIFEPGVYVCDLKTKHCSLVIRNASCATWSPDGKYIVYELDNCLYRSSPDFSTKELLYNARAFEQISRGLFWLNNGKNILLRSSIRPFGIRMLTNQEVKLIWTEDKRCELTNLILLNGLYDIKDEKPI